MRIGKTILMACFMANATTTALAVSVFNQVTKANVQEMPIVIRATREGSNMLFRVAVDPKGGGDGAGAGTVLQKDAGLQLFKAPKDISPVNIGSGSHSPPPISSRAIHPAKMPANMHDVHSPFNGRGVLYEFVVSTNTLDSSVFSVSYYVSGHPAFICDWFVLKDFAGTK